MEDEIVGPRVQLSEFNALFAEYLQDFVRYSHYVNRGGASSEDFVSEAYLLVRRAIEGGKGPSCEGVKPYVFSVLKNLVKSQLRDPDNRLLDSDALEDCDVQDQEYVPESHIATWDESAATRAFAALSERSQLVLKLHYFYGMKYADIAQKLHSSESVALSAAHRAREALRRAYLVEIAQNEPTCSRMRKEQIAAYVLGKSPRVRRQRIDNHLKDCAECRYLAKHMRNYNVPTLVVVGLAAGASVFSDFFTAPLRATAVGLTPSGFWGGSVLGVLAKPLVALLVFAVVPAILTLSPGFAVRADGPGYPVNQQSQEHDPPGGQPKQDREANDMTRIQEPEVSTGEGVSGSGGVAAWLPTPTSFVAGSEHVTLHLAVTLVEAEDDEVWSLIVRLPHGVSASEVPEGCQFDQGIMEIGCLLPLSQNESLQQQLQFVVNVADGIDPEVPQAILVRK